MAEGSGSGSSAKGGGGKRARNAIPALEWIAGGIGLLLTLGILGLIGSEAWKDAGEAPPAIEAKVERITPFAAGHVVEVKLENRSPATAAAVQVQGKLMRGGETVATSSAVMDYVPGESSRRAGLFFTEDPRRYRLEVRALGYTEP
jgi:uncharacterized protein (TIGR02588 family)